MATEQIRLVAAAGAKAASSETVARKWERNAQIGRQTPHLPFRERSFVRTSHD